MRKLYRAKRALAVLLSVLLLSGSVGGVTAYAGEAVYADREAGTDGQDDVPREGQSGENPEQAEDRVSSEDVSTEGKEETLSEDASKIEKEETPSEDVSKIEKEETSSGGVSFVEKDPSEEESGGESVSSEGASAGGDVPSESESTGEDTSAENASAGEGVTAVEHVSGGEYVQEEKPSAEGGISGEYSYAGESAREEEAPAEESAADRTACAEEESPEGKDSAEGGASEESASAGKSSPEGKDSAEGGASEESASAGKSSPEGKDSAEGSVSEEPDFAGKSSSEGKNPAEGSGTGQDVPLEQAPDAAVEAESEPALGEGEGDGEQQNYAASWSELQEAFTQGGEIWLSKDITAADGDAALTVPKKKSVTLHLNGKTIDRNLESPVKNGSVIIVQGSLTIEGEGAITGGSCSGVGGGIWVKSGGGLTLAGGSITGNHSKNIGGGVYVSGTGACFSMTGGSITENSSVNGGGIAVDSSGGIYLYGGTISGNTASGNGGGVWFGGTLTELVVSGGSITGNSAGRQGGGVYINGEGNFSYESTGTISGNTAPAGSDIASKDGTYVVSYNITIGSSGEGMVTASVNGENVTEAHEGDVVTLAVSENEDWRLRSLTVTAGGTAVPTEEQPDGTYVFTMPASGVTVSAAFGELHEVSTGVSLYGDEYGGTEHGCTLTADKEYAVEGETVTLTLHMEPGYKYLSSDVNYTIPTTKVSDTTFTFVMPDGYAEAFAYIEKAEYTVALGGSAGSNVRFLLNNEPRDSAPFQAEYNDTVTVIFDPYVQLINGMTYTCTENGETVTRIIDYSWNDTGSLEGSFRMPDGDVVVRVEYNTIYSITADEGSMSDGLAFADVTKAAAGETVTVTAIPDDLYELKAWHVTYGAEQTAVAVTQAQDDPNKAAFVMPEGDVTFYAEFERAYYGIDIGDFIPHGTLAVEGSGNTFAEPNALVTLAAVPDAGYATAAVTVRYGGTEINCDQGDGNTWTFTMPEADVTADAVFDLADSWEDLADALQKGGEIVLKHDYSAKAGDSQLVVPKGKTVTLDLNGHIVDGSALTDDDVLWIDGSFVLKDSSGRGSGALIGAGGEDVVYLTGEAFRMEGGRIAGSESRYGCVYVEIGCRFEMSGGILDAQGGLQALTCCGTASLIGGTVTGSCTDLIYAECGTLTILGGTVSGSPAESGFGIDLVSSTLTVGGAFEIDHGVFLDSESMVYVGGGLQNVVPIAVRAEDTGIFAEGINGYVMTDNDLSRFVSSDPACGIRMTGEQKAELYERQEFIVIFEPGGGTGEMEWAAGYDGDTFILPACTYTAPEGRVFKEWSVQIGEDAAAVAMAPGEEIVLTAEVTVTAVWEDKPTEPVFKKQSLLLSGQIGVNFYMDLPELEGVDYSSSYMEFTVNDTTTRADYDPDKKNRSGQYYGFTCYVTSIQMAEPIKAVFHYGDDGKVEKTYSVADYISYFDSHTGEFDDETLSMIQSIADYGHYVQPFLSAANGWGLGTDYRTMENHYAEAYVFDDVKAAVEGYGFSAEIGETDVEKVTYRMVLDSETSLDVFFRLKENAGEFSASSVFGGKTYQAARQQDGRWRIRIEGISAHLLGEEIAVTGNCGGMFSVNVSALSYVRAVLNSEGFDEGAKNAVCALYYYNDAVKKYRKSH